MPMNRRALVLALFLLPLLYGKGSAGDDGILFEGNESLTEQDLRDAASEELSDFRSQGGRKADIDDAAWRMENLYRKKGYAFAEVRYTYEKTEAAPEVSFIFEEGPRVLLGDVTLTGNEAVKTEDLEAFFDTGKGGDVSFVRKDFEEAAGSLRAYYYGKGFIKAEVDPPRIVFTETRDRADVALTVREAPRHFIRKVVFTGDLHSELGEDLRRLAGELEGEVFQMRKKNILSSRTAEIYGVAGYADVEVQVDVQEGETPGDVILAAAVTSGPRVRIRDVRIEGQQKTRLGIIKKEVKVRPGDWYDVKKVVQSIDRINRLGVFSSVEASFDEGDKGAGERTLLFRLEEAPSKEVMAEAGWGSYEKARGRIGYKEKNLFGTALHGEVILGGSLKSRSVESRISDSTFMGSKFIANFPLEYRWREEPSYTEESFEGAFHLLRKVSRHLTLSAKYAFKNTDTRNISASEPDPNLQEDYNLGSVMLRLARETRDNIFYPSAGSTIALSGEWADPLLGGDISFFRFNLNSSFFHAFAKDTVIALRFDTGLIYPTDEKTSVPLAERFFNGGENTVRSFTEDQVGPKDVEGDPLGGLVYNVLSLELRQRLKGNIAGSLFVDAGNVAPNLSRVEQGLPPYESATDAWNDALEQYFSDLRYAVGLGLQYLLPIGAARLDFAVNPDRREGEDQWLVHFTLGMSF